MRIAVITDAFLESEKELLKRGSLVQLFNLMKGCKEKYNIDFVVYQMGVDNRVCFYKGIMVNVLKCSSLQEYIDILKELNIECDILHFNNVDCYFENNCKFSTATVHTNAFLEKNLTLLYDISKNISKLFVVNKAYMNMYKSIKNIINIPNGIDVKFFKNNKVRKKHNKKIFFPNIPSDKKNSQFAYNLIKKLGNDYTLFIPENKFKTDDNIKFLGRGISKRKMKKMYKKCYYVVVPSISESCSLCSLEAMAMKNYIIANDIIGIKDYVIHDLINVNDIDLWVERIKNIDQNLALTYINENYQNLINNYTIDIMVEKYYENWKGLVQINEGNSYK